jgi:hypothetical protein
MSVKVKVLQKGINWEPPKEIEKEYQMAICLDMYLEYRLDFQRVMVKEL